jgi:hypothetical protein
MSNQTDELTRALHERSEVMSGTHVSFEDVKGRARGIRRRRRAASGIAVAAVALAVAVPMGINLDGVDRGQRPLPADQPTTTTEPTGQAEPRGPVEIDAAKARRGEDPAITYLSGSTLHPSGGADVGLPEAYSAVAPYADGWVGISVADGTTTFLDASGRPTQEPYPGASAAVTADGQWLATVLYATGGVDMQLWPTAGADPQEGYGSHVVAFEGQLEYAGFLGPETIAYNLTTDGRDGATVTPYVADWYGEGEPREIPGLLSVRAANEADGTVSGMTSLDQLAGEACYAVVDPATGDERWETCDYALDGFSPDGRYVVGTDAFADGLGGRQVAILEASTGDVVAEYATQERAYHQDPVWESGSTVLVPVYQDGAWFLVRLRPDGTVEKALDDARTGDETVSPWRFAVRP